MNIPSALDIFLDDIIKKNKKSAAGKSRGPIRGSAHGPARRLPNRFRNRSAPYSVEKELFSDSGNLKHYSIHYSRSGRSKGTAEVVFSRRGDALAAVKRYNDVLLDGKSMKIEFVGTNTAMPTIVSHISNGSYGKLNDVFKSAPGRGTPGWPRGGGHGGGGAVVKLFAQCFSIVFCISATLMPSGLSGHLVTALEDQFIWLV
ncbi:putative THO complex subunit [Cocos nucifera]|uniref:Putative THO complex subunit n=1 Tax=Cocos nucifera TaxID=13894 RepID=A0A8K0I7P3_COCNU|nr:putative THO complex subunit [Cocos nucifera]